MTSNRGKISMEILSGMLFCHFELSHCAASQLLLQEIISMDREIISPALWKKIQEQWQHDDFFGPQHYSNKLDIALEGWVH